MTTYYYPLLGWGVGAGEGIFDVFRFPGLVLFLYDKDPFLRVTVSFCQNKGLKGLGHEIEFKYFDKNGYI